MPATYEPIATTTLGATATSFSFSSISSAYTDLRLVIVPEATSSGGTVRFRYNSDTGTNYAFTRLSGNGSLVTSTTGADEANIATSGTSISAQKPALVTLDLFSYAGSTFKTALITVANAQNNRIDKNIGLWRSTAAINSITVLLSSQSFEIGTTATLYGILKA